MTAPMVKRIAVTGPESTGKTRLVRGLASHYNAVWVPEFAREYVERIGRPYTYNDILVIVKEHIVRENTLLSKANRFLFCDTDIIVAKIWCDVKYGTCHSWIRDAIESHRYDLYLLCNIDVPWKGDPLREHPYKRQYIYELYLAELKNRKLPFYIISGLGDVRLKHAVQIIDKNLKM